MRIVIAEPVSVVLTNGGDLPPYWFGLRGFGYGDVQKEDLPLKAAVLRRSDDYPDRVVIREDMDIFAVTDFIRDSHTPGFEARIWARRMGWSSSVEEDEEFYESACRFVKRNITPLIGKFRSRAFDWHNGIEVPCGSQFHEPSRWFISFKRKDWKRGKDIARLYLVQNNLQHEVSLSAAWRAGFLHLLVKEIKKTSA